VVIADFDSERMERTVEEILELGIADALALSTDVRSDASVRAMAGDAIKAMGQVDILITWRASSWRARSSGSRPATGSDAADEPAGRGPHDHGADAAHEGEALRPHRQRGER